MTGLSRTAAVAAVVALGLAYPAAADDARLEGDLTGASVVPPVETGGLGSVEASLDTDTGEITWFINYRGLSGPATAISLHGPAGSGENADAVFAPSNIGRPPILGGTTFGPDVVEQFLAGDIYLVVATGAFPEGELRAQLTVTEIEAAGGDE